MNRQTYALLAQVSTPFHLHLNNYTRCFFPYKQILFPILHVRLLLCALGFFDLFPRIWPATLTSRMWEYFTVQTPPQSGKNRETCANKTECFSWKYLIPPCTPTTTPHKRNFNGLFSLKVQSLSHGKSN